MQNASLQSAIGEGVTGLVVQGVRFEFVMHGDRIGRAGISPTLTSPS
jgi:hypothetical protein